MLLESVKYKLDDVVVVKRGFYEGKSVKLSSHGREPWWRGGGVFYVADLITTEEEAANRDLFSFATPTYIRQKDLV